MTTEPYPAIDGPEDLAALRVHSFVECADCLEYAPLREDELPLRWAELHQRSKPGHKRYRTERTTQFSLPAQKSLATTEPASSTV